MDNKKMLEEATKRIDLLRLHPDVKNAWEENETIYYSDPCRIGSAAIGALYWLRNEERFVKAVKDLEDKFNCKVYHVIHSQTEFGELLTCLVVTSHEEDWEFDRSDLEEPQENGIIACMAYVINLSDPFCSEFGSVGIREAGGGLVRVY